MKKTGKIILSEDESFFGENLFEEKVFPKPLSKTFLNWKRGIFYLISVYLPDFRVSISWLTEVIGSSVRIPPSGR